MRTQSQWRSLTGVIIGAYATMHLLNHALGLISLETQEAVRPWVMLVWHSLPGQVLLYGALAGHAALGLVSLGRRRHYRMPRWEAVQIILGLCIPYLLLVHIVNTRGTRFFTGIDITYPYEIANLWVDPWTRTKQIALVLLVWGHFVTGLHYWLRIKTWYAHRQQWILLCFVLVPVLSLLGFAEVGMKVSAHARAEPAWMAKMKKAGVPLDKERAQAREFVKYWAPAGWIGIVGLVLVGAQWRHWVQRHRRIIVRYPDGPPVDAQMGMSILEVSRGARRPLLSVCGGRGRCTTCRVRVDKTARALPEPGLVEARALAWLGSPQGVRLACQLRPVGNLSVQPLLHASLATLDPTMLPEGHTLGEERCLSVVFMDLRGSTKFAETRLPFDVVFLLNLFFAEMARAVEDAGGHYSNFTGDGLMALFGLAASPDKGARAAMQCALRMLEGLERLNTRLAPELPNPLEIGIGVHTGDAIVGRMGPPKTPVITALGDTVNTTARLEGLTKKYGAPVVISVQTFDAAGIKPEGEMHEAVLRGRSAPLLVAALGHEALAKCLGEAKALSSAE